MSRNEEELMKTLNIIAFTACIAAFSFGAPDPEAVCHEFVVKVGAYQVDERR